VLEDSSVARNQGRYGKTNRFLVLDDKSPKLYFLPNLDSANFDSEKIEETI